MEENIKRPVFWGDDNSGRIRRMVLEADIVPNDIRVDTMEHVSFKDSSGRQILCRVLKSGFLSDEQMKKEFPDWKGKPHLEIYVDISNLIME